MGNSPLHKAARNLATSLNEMRQLLPGLSDKEIFTVAWALTEGQQQVPPVVAPPPPPPDEDLPGVPEDLKVTLRTIRILVQPFRALQLAQAMNMTPVQMGARLRRLRELGFVKHAGTDATGAHDWKAV